MRYCLTHDYAVCFRVWQPAGRKDSWHGRSLKRYAGWKGALYGTRVWKYVEMGMAEHVLVLKDPKG